MSSENLPYQDASFDIVVGVDFLEHVRDLNRLIEECLRVLRMRGKMYFSAPIMGLSASPEHLHNFTEENFKNVFEAHDLKVDVYFERCHWGVIKPDMIIVEATRDV